MLKITLVLLAGAVGTGCRYGLSLSKSPKNTPSIAEGLDGDEFGIGGASPTINSGYKVI